MWIPTLDTREATETVLIVKARTDAPKGARSFYIQVRIAAPFSSAIVTYKKNFSGSHKV